MLSFIFEGNPYKNSVKNEILQNRKSSYSRRPPSPSDNKLPFNKLSTPTSATISIISVLIMSLMTLIPICHGDIAETQMSCPLGLLLLTSVLERTEIGTLTRDRYQGLCTYKDFCTSDELRCAGPFNNYGEVLYLRGNVTVTEDFHYLRGTPSNDALLSREKRTAPGELKILSQNTAGATPELIDETRRMFYFLKGLSPTDVSPDLELSKLLPDLFHVIRRRCDPRELEPSFLDSTQKAFLWLLREHGTGEIPDISGEAARNMRRMLHQCAHNHNVISVHGTNCMETITAVSLPVPGIGTEAVKEYKYDEPHAFQWGLYDPVVDSVWLSIDTVHTLCTPFLEKHGLMHEFQSNMIKLLMTERMIQRWINSTPMMRQEGYDQAFLSPMSESMRILDACNLAGTIKSPFGRSRRPIPKHMYRSHRVRRSVRTISPEGDIPNQRSAYCLQSEEDKSLRVEEVRKSLCRK